MGAADEKDDEAFGNYNNIDNDGDKVDNNNDDSDDDDNTTTTNHDSDAIMMKTMKC